MADDLIHREKFQVAYVGDRADDHTMDVEALGPALIAFGNAARQSKTHVQRQSAIHLMVEELRAGLRPSSPKPPEAVA